MEAAGRAEKELDAHVQVIKKTSPEYARAKEQFPCPSVLVNGRIIARNDTITFQGLKAAIEGETTV